MNPWPNQERALTLTLAAIDAIEPYFREIAPLLLTPAGEPVRSSTDAGHAAEQLLTWRDALPRRIRATRAALARPSHTPSAAACGRPASSALRSG
jgi:hypothetical protein